MSCCKKGVTTVTLNHPSVYSNFISYPTFCHSLDILAYYEKAEIVFPAQSTVKGNSLPISILTCTTNTPLYDVNGKAIKPSDIEIGRPYPIYFCPIVGGYVLKGFTCEELIPTSVKGVDKK